MKRELGRWVAGWCACAAALACQPDWLAGPCNRTADGKNADVVYNGMKPKDGDNYISQNPALFTTCDNFLCLSSNGSIPYCTKACGSDTECVNGNNVAMECRVVTEFGPLACRSPSHDECVAQQLVEPCLARCPTSCGSDATCKTKCEEACNNELCCARDETTHGVKDPALYCLAKDGQVAHDPKAAPIGS